MNNAYRKIVCLLLAATATFCTPDSVWAQKPQLPVRLKLEPLSIRGRSGGPIPLRIKLEYNSNQIRQGDLVLHIYNSVMSSEDLMATVRYEGIVLQGTDYIFNTVLPPIEHSHNKQYLVTGWFETDTERIPLTADVDMVDPPEPHELLSIGSFERSTVTCSCSGERDYHRASGTRAFLNRVLGLDNYNPNSRISQNQSNQGQRRLNMSELVQNYAAFWDAYDLPEDPIQLCSFDVVLLADGALSRLVDAQMKALETWIAAGGSLCVLPDDTRLAKPHLQFLQTLFERTGDADLHLSITDESTLLVISGKPNPIVNRHFGLGRVTLLPNVDDLPSILQGAELGRVVGHLWKVHSDSKIFDGEAWNKQSIEQVLKERGFQVSKSNGGIWQVIAPPGTRGQQRFDVRDLEEVGNQYNISYELQPKPNPLSSACETALLPKGIEMVPTWVIATLLIAYVTMIGPVDYFLLGYFRIRKYTWLLFPLVTAVFTGLTILIAHQYMSSTDTGGSITIVDIGNQGVALRQSDIRMHFYASQTTTNTESTQSFVVPGQMLVTDPYNGSPAPRPINARMTYSGRFPQAFSTSQNMRQWEPLIVRSFTLAPSPEGIPKINWDDLDLVSTNDGRLQLQAMIASAKPAGAEIDAVVMHGQQRFTVAGNNGFLFSPTAIAQGQQWLEMDVWQRRYSQPPHDAIAAVGVIQAAARTGTRDFFSIVSQVSPHGAASLEDLPVLDTTDDNQWLLMVAVRNKNVIKLYRRLYIANEPQ